MKEYLEAGKIINKRGLKGEVKVESYCDSPEALCAVPTLYFDDAGGQAVKVLSAKPYRGFVYLLLEGVTGPEAADALRGRVLYANRKDIPVPDGRVFLDDIIGLPVYDAESGRIYGTLTEVFPGGAGEIYTVEDGAGKKYYVPAVPAFIAGIDPEKGVAVKPIPGMFDEAEEIL